MSGARACLWCFIGALLSTTVLLLTLGPELTQLTLPRSNTYYQKPNTNTNAALTELLPPRTATATASATECPCPAGARVPTSPLCCVCVGVTIDGDPCMCSRGCLGPRSGPFAPSHARSARCTLPEPPNPPMAIGRACYDQSEPREYEYLDYYRQQQQHQQPQAKSESEPRGPLHSTIEPPAYHRDGNCAVTFRHVVMTGGHHLILYTNDSYAAEQLSAHSNTGLLYGRLSVSFVGSPLINRYSMTYTRDLQSSYREQVPKCTRHHKQPVFVLGSRDQMLGNYYHFWSELFNLAFWTLANPTVNALTPIPDSQQRGSSTLAWRSSGAAIVHYSGGYYAERLAIKLSDLTPGIPVQPIYTEQDKPANPHIQGVECFDQVTIASENNLNIFSATLIRRQVQPLLDWMDWRYNVSEQYTARKHGWKVFVSSLVRSPSNPDPRPHVVISVRKSGPRFLHNMTSVVSLFDRHGFRVSPMDFTGLPIKRTIEIIRTAHVLFAVHGAGISNSVFLHAGATMIQLLSPVHHIHRPVFPRLAWNVGAQYLEMDIIERKDTTVHIDDWVRLEALIVSARTNVLTGLLGPDATWSPTRPTKFKWHVAPRVPMCALPLVEQNS